MSLIRILTSVMRQEDSTLSSHRDRKIRATMLPESADIGRSVQSSFAQTGR
jgi:hypothetical protein